MIGYDEVVWREKKNSKKTVITMIEVTMPSIYLGDKNQKHIQIGGETLKGNQI